MTRPRLKRKSVIGGVGGGVPTDMSGTVHSIIVAVTIAEIKPEKTAGGRPRDNLGRTMEPGFGVGVFHEFFAYQFGGNELMQGRTLIPEQVN